MAHASVCGDAGFHPCCRGTWLFRASHLDAQLISRTNRSLNLTDEGRQYYERSREILEALAEAETATFGVGLLGG